MNEREQHKSRHLFALISWTIVTVILIALVLTFNIIFFTTSNSTTSTLLIMIFLAFMLPFALLTWLLFILSYWLAAAYNYDRNLFRRNEALKSFYILTFQYSKLKTLNKRYKTSLAKLDLFEKLCKRDLVVDGSNAIQLKYDGYYRQTGDIDCIPCKNIDLVQFLKNEGIDYDGNIVRAKFPFKNNTLDISNATIVPKAMTEKWHWNIRIANSSWILAAKFIQIFELANAYLDNKYNSEYLRVIMKKVDDLCFLLSKDTFLDSLKVLPALKTVMVSYAAAHFIKNHEATFNFYDDFSQLNFRSFIKEQLSVTEGYGEAINFLNTISKRLLISRKAKKLWMAINYVLKDAKEIKEELVNEAILIDMPNNSFTVQIDPKLYATRYCDNKKTYETDLYKQSFNFAEFDKSDIRLIFIKEVERELIKLDKEM
ncbi:MAG4530 family protein [Mycoplasmopsis adleri]|uniref:MAG4530 family protein n=1 Tax=Mycoplasmopsis adleri TaxID=51362 RepID=UPI003873BC90